MIESTDQTKLLGTVESFHPNYIKVDERSIQELMELFIAYTKQIPFLDEKGNTLGTWDEMYIEQTLYLWVYISRLNLSLLDSKKRFLIGLWNLDKEPKAIDFLLSVLNILKDLYTKSLKVNATWATDEIVAVIKDSLAINVRSLSSLSKTVERVRLNSWIEWSEKKIKKRDYEPDKPDTNVKDLFRTSVNDALNCLFILQKKVKGKAFEKTMQNGKNPPHIGLLYGFLKSYQHIQAKFNELPKRHIDYYYKTILKQEPLSAQPDFVHLFMKLIPGVVKTNIEKGTPFLAGVNEEGEDIIYETVRPFRLTAAEITEVRTLLFHKNEHIVPLRADEMVTGVYMDEIPDALITQKLGERDPWALFGEPHEYRKNKKLPDLGWAIASPLFDLSDGKRTIQLIFQITQKSADEFSVILDTLSKAITTASFNSDEKVDKTELCHRFFSDAFELRISTSEGWFFIEDYVSTITIANSKKNEIRNTLSIAFSLSTDMPAWISYKEKIHGPSYDTRLPLITCKLKQDSVYYPYSLLKEMKIEFLDINTDVVGFNKVIVFNKHGMVDTTNPFPILGMNPLRGNRCFIGAKEWRQKKISDLKCKIDWVDLPKPGFGEYYEEYVTASLTDTSFLVAINNGAREESPLFTSIDDEIQDQTELTCTTINKPVDTLIKENEEEVFNPKNIPSAFISIELVGPQEGFGHDIYLDEMALYGQRVLKARKKQIPFPPKRPYVPLARSLEVNYKATQRIIFDNTLSAVQDQPFDFFHLHPYGVIKEGDQRKMHKSQLLPDYDARGYLFIGLEKASPNSLLSIFLKLIPSLEPLRDDKKDLNMTIDYLSGSVWESLSDNTDENTTMWGQETGTIRLYLKDDWESDHPLFDRKKNWIRISVDSKYLGAIGRCVNINTNVVVVKRKLGTSDSSVSALQPFSIAGLLHKNAKIQTVLQPFYSFGGRHKEEESRFYARISNRLGHKNRMVRKRDYRRMILEKFSEVNWIEVLTASEYGNSSGADRIDPGTVKLVVMPKIETTTDRSGYNVPKHIQLKIEEFVIKHCAPGLTIKVVSPEYEEVMVRCKLVRKDADLIIPYIDIANIIRRQIAPWLYHEKSSYRRVHIEFSVSNLILAMSRHANVSYVEYCQVIRISKDKDGYRYFDSYSHGDIITPTSGKSILIPAKGFNVYQTADQKAENAKLAISSMNIDDTFIITQEPQKSVAKSDTPPSISEVPLET